MKPELDGYRPIDKMDDPTREEIDAVINAMPFASEFSDFDKEEAIHCFATGWHGGQWSNLYAILSESEYTPSRIGRGLSDMAQLIHDELENAFCK